MLDFGAYAVFLSFLKNYLTNTPIGYIIIV